MSGTAGNCLSTIFMAMGITILVYTARIYIYTKEDPFKDDLPSLEEREVLYFEPTQASLYQKQEPQKQCICENKVLNDFCTEEQIKSGCKDITLNTQKNPKKFLRYLLETYQCNEFRDKILSPSIQNLNQVFDLKFGMINKMALGLLILAAIGLAIFGLIILATCFSLCCGEAALALLIPFLPCIICFGLGSGITELVLFIILCVNYGNGQTSEFVEFLNCQGVKSSAFTEKYKDIINLKDNYTPFMVLYIIFLVLNFCQSFFSNQKKEE